LACKIAFFNLPLPIMMVPYSLIRYKNTFAMCYQHMYKSIDFLFLWPIAPCNSFPHPSIITNLSPPFLHLELIKTNTHHPRPS
jgi:hypothetical protein